MIGPSLTVCEKNKVSQKETLKMYLLTRAKFQ